MRGGGVLLLLCVVCTCFHGSEAKASRLAKLDLTTLRGHTAKPVTYIHAIWCQTKVVAELPPAIAMFVKRLTDIAKQSKMEFLLHDCAELEERASELKLNAEAIKKMKEAAVAHPETRCMAVLGDIARMALVHQTGGFYVDISTFILNEGYFLKTWKKINDGGLQYYGYRNWHGGIYRYDPADTPVEKRGWEYSVWMFGAPQGSTFLAEVMAEQNVRAAKVNEFSLKGLVTEDPAFEARFKTDYFAMGHFTYQKVLETNPDNRANVVMENVMSVWDDDHTPVEVKKCHDGAGASVFHPLKMDTCISRDLDFVKVFGAGKSIDVKNFNPLLVAALAARKTALASASYADDCGGPVEEPKKN